ncbi:hypothetical protein GCM10007049_31170 [Echinicola pacifica]|uniref:Uncharacterized protein n=1 Tax=Echinicola pacifica TaxID=346377 RepID=A0A918Q935_9BACT|nr:hypothetical protein GCM10007049_31170 [Echinicola pacifica]
MRLQGLFHAARTAGAAHADYAYFSFITHTISFFLGPDINFLLSKTCFADFPELALFFFLQNYQEDALACL